MEDLCRLSHSKKCACPEVRNEDAWQRLCEAPQGRLVIALPTMLHEVWKLNARCVQCKADIDILDVRIGMEKVNFDDDAIARLKPHIEVHCACRNRCGWHAETPLPVTLQLWYLLKSLVFRP